jgi:cyclase
MTTAPTISRRDFVLSSAAFVTLAGTGLAFPRRAFAAWRLDVTFYKWQEIAPGFKVALNPTDDFNLVGGNSTLVTRKGPTGGPPVSEAVVIDTKQTVLAPSLLREAKVHAQSIAVVLNTHHHGDHTGGNAAFSQGGAKLYAHAKCRERVAGMMGMYTAGLDNKIAALEKVPVEGAKQAAADAKAFKDNLARIKAADFTPEGTLGDGTKLDAAQSAGRKVEVHHVGPGHTDNDVFFFFPEDNVLVAGDLIFNKLHAFYDQTAGPSIKGWIKSLERVVQLCNAKTVVVPGHGEVDNVEAAKRQIKYFEDVQAAVTRAIKDNKKREEVLQMSLPQYSEHGLKQAQPLVLGGAYDEMMKEKGEK